MPEPTILPADSPFRRIVTTRGVDGKSQVLIDGRARNLGTLHELWMTDQGVDPLDPALIADAVQRAFVISPSTGGTVFRFVEIEPEAKFAHMSDEERRAAVKHAFAVVGSSNALVNTERHAAMHQTESIDYIVLLRGRLTMLLEDGEVELEPFDVVVQRGTNHAWVNNGTEPALLAAILIAA